jgi:hypothetical protein
MSVRLALLLLVPLAIAGCGGGSASNIPKNVSPNEGTKVDIKVSKDSNGIAIPEAGKKK